MCLDEDIKIAGEKPSAKIKAPDVILAESAEYQREKDNGNIEKAVTLGKKLADEFIKACKNDSFDACENDNDEPERQKILLLSFTVIALLESMGLATCTVKIAKASFNDSLEKTDKLLYQRSSDTGAFSFYYLSYRRGTEVDRRMGQTFAMLCSHDGDPIYQELGEAIYCWFSSAVKKLTERMQFTFPK